MGLWYSSKLFVQWERRVEVHVLSICLSTCSNHLLRSFSFPDWTASVPPRKSINHSGFPTLWCAKCHLVGHLENGRFYVMWISSQFKKRTQLTTCLHSLISGRSVLFHWCKRLCLHQIPTLPVTAPVLLVQKLGSVNPPTLLFFKSTWLCGILCIFMYLSELSQLL